MKIASEMLVLIGSFDNTVIVSAYIKKLAQELTLDEHSLLVEFKKIKHAALSPMHEKKTPVSVKPFLASLASERLLVKLMLEEQELIENLKGKITPADFRDSHLSRIVERMFDLFCQGKKIDAKSLVNDFSDSSLSAVICELAAGDGPQSPDRGKAMDDCIKRMKEDTRKLKQREICEKMKLAEAQKDEHRLKELLEEFQCLSKKGG